MMKYNELGKTGVLVSELCLGTIKTHAFPPFEIDEYAHMIHLSRF